MDIYHYSAEDKTFNLPLTRYEGHLEHYIPYRHSWEMSVFVPCVYGTPETVETAILLEKAKRLNQIMVKEIELLQYRYSIKVVAQNGSFKSSGAGSICGCHYKGELLSAKAGPGVCQLTRNESFDVECGEHRIKQLEAVRVLDMRTLKSVTLDSGEVLKPERRRKETQLPSKIHELLKFLETLTAEHVLVTVSLSQ